MASTTTKLATAVIVLFFLAAWNSVMAQQPQLARIGLITSGSPAASVASVDAFRQHLQERGYVEGRNLAIEARNADEIRYAAALPERYRSLVAELVGLRVDAIVVPGTVATRAAKEVTSTIPIVMVSAGNAVGAGLVKSLAQPGGNVTGQSFMGPELHLKEFDLLTEVLPRAKRIAALFNPEIATESSGSRALDAAAPSKGVTLQFVPIRRADDLDLAAMGQARPDALLVFAVSEIQQLQIVEFAAKNRIPAVYGFREAVDAGGLMSFGPRLSALWRGAANYVDRILKGARPGDLPVEQPTRFELIVNLKAAKVLGVTIPPSVRTRADLVIE